MQKMKETQQRSTTLLSFSVSDIRIQPDGSKIVFIAQNFGFEGQSHRKGNNSASEDELFKYICTTCLSKMLSSSLGLHTEIILKLTLS